MEQQQHLNQNNGVVREHSRSKVRLMLSYGGRIQQRPRDHQLSYAGGDTKILTVDRNINFLDIVAKVKSLCNTINNQFKLKYQLPGEDLDALVSIINDDDVKNMMFEYDRMHLISSATSPRIRLFVFSSPPRALVNPDFLFGFDKEYDPNSTPDFEVPKSVGHGGEFGSGQENERVLTTEIQGKMVESRECHVTRHSNTPAAQAPLIYWVPVNAGGEMGNREQPVYSCVPVMPIVPDQKLISGVRMAATVAPTGDVFPQL